MRNLRLPIPHLAFAFFLLLLSAPPAFSFSDADLKHWIESRAARTPVLMTADEVRVDVDDGFVVLSGQVHLLAQRMEYDQIAWQTIGVREVDNEIVVIPAEVSSDSEIERKVRWLSAWTRTLLGSGSEATRASARPRSPGPGKGPRTRTPDGVNERGTHRPSVLM